MDDEGVESIVPIYLTLTYNKKTLLDRKERKKERTPLSSTSHRHLTPRLCAQRAIQ